MSSSIFQNQINEINSSLDELNKIVENDTKDKEELLEQQNHIKNIVEKERQKLEKTELQYQESADTQKREIMLKKNSSLRMQQYNSFTIVVVITIAILVILSLIVKYLPIFPEALITILRIIVIVTGSIWGFNILSEIENRDPLNYNKLNLEKPNIDSPESIQKKRKIAEQEGDLLGTISVSGCSGEDCCDIGTKWDSEKMLCVPIEESFDNIMPNQPSNYFAKL